MRKIFVITLIIFTFASLLHAEIPINDKILLDGSIRYRLEADDKDFNSDTGMNEYSYLQTMVGVKINVSDDLLARAKIKDSRFLGTSGSNQESTSKIDMQEAYILADRLFALPLSVQLGRFEMFYGRKRIMGSGSWSNYGPRTYDGCRFNMNTDVIALDIFYNKIAEKGFVDQPPYTDEQFKKTDRSLLGINVSLLDGKIQPLLIIDSDSEPELEDKSIAKDPNLMTTSAIYFDFNYLGVRVQGDAAYQSGMRNDRDLSSFMLALDAIYELNHNIKPSFGLGIDLTSGNPYNEDTDNDEDNVFYADFMSKHHFRGYMDYFRKSDEFRQGLIDFIIRFGLQPSDNTKFTLDFHDFSPYEEAMSEKSISTYTYYGQEIDFKVKTELKKGLFLDTALCAFIPGEDWALDKFGKDDTSLFFYMTLMTKF